MKRKLAPFQISNPNNHNYKSGKIYWEAHLEAFKGYSKRYGSSQSAERLAERGGFGEEELDEFYPEWRSYIYDPTSIQMKTPEQKAEEYVDGLSDIPFSSVEKKWMIEAYLKGHRCLKRKI